MRFGSELVDRIQMFGQMGVVEESVNLFVAGRAEIDRRAGSGLFAFDGLPGHEMVYGQAGHFAIAQLALHGGW